MNEVRLQIDGKEVSTAEGTTIFEAARSVGIEIPHLCYREDLSPTAACRLCVVEVEGARNLVASCAYPVANNLVVRTNTERVIKTRRLVIELLLSDHPFDCMTCEKSGACELERYAYELGVATTRFQGEKHDYPLDETNPFFVRDYNKCILCERCVKACSDVQFVEAIDFAHRGFSTKVASPFDRSLLESTCIFCGQCVASCPVGALVDDRIGRGGDFNDAVILDIEFQIAADAAVRADGRYLLQFPLTPFAHAGLFNQGAHRAGSDTLPAEDTGAIK